MKSNIPAIFVCHMTGIVARALAAPVPASQTLRLVPNVLLSCFFFAYCFDIANQATSVPEDKINKPNRPIPSGLMSMNGAYLRWCLSWILGPVILYSWVGNWAAIHLLWFESLVFFCYAYPKPSHWFFRNAFSALGYFNISRLVNACVYQEIPEWNVHISPDTIVATWTMLHIHLQEFHDIEGDRANGRKTIPLTFGPGSHLMLRNATALCLCSWGFGVLIWSWASDELYHRPVRFCVASLHAISAFLLSFRTTRLRTRGDDERTYRIYYYIATFTVGIYFILNSYRY